MNGSTVCGRAGTTPVVVVTFRAPVTGSGADTAKTTATPPEGFSGGARTDTPKPATAASPSASRSHEIATSIAPPAEGGIGSVVWPPPEGNGTGPVATKVALCNCVYSDAGLTTCQSHGGHTPSAAACEM